MEWYKDVDILSNRRGGTDIFLKFWTETQKLTWSDINYGPTFITVFASQQEKEILFLRLNKRVKLPDESVIKYRLNPALLRQIAMMDNNTLANIMAYERANYLLCEFLGIHSETKKKHRLTSTMIVLFNVMMTRWEKLVLDRRDHSGDRARGRQYSHERESVSRDSTYEDRNYRRNSGRQCTDWSMGIDGVHMTLPEFHTGTIQGTLIEQGETIKRTMTMWVQSTRTTEWVQARQRQSVTHAANGGTSHIAAGIE